MVVVNFYLATTVGYLDFGRFPFTSSIPRSLIEKKSFPNLQSATNWLKNTKDMAGQSIGRCSIGTCRTRYDLVWLVVALLARLAVD